VLTFIVLGLFAGSIYALASLGIVLTYKTTGIFNFAYGGVAMFCAYVFWQLRDQWHLTQWLALPLLVLVVAPAIGLALEALFRSLAATSVEVQIVVALGLLAFFTTLVTIIWGGEVRFLPSIFPSGKFSPAHDVYITGNQAGTFIMALVLGAALYVLLNRTRLGTATRAVVDNRDLSGLVGANAVAVGQVAWVVSTIFAAIAGVLLSTNEGLVTYVLPFLVIYSFAPAVLGRLTNLPLAFAGAMALGLIINILTKYGSSGNLAKFETALPYLALFLLLVGYGKRLTEVRSSVRSTGGSRVVTHGWRGLAVGVAGVIAAVAIIPHVFGQSTIQDVAQAMAYAVVALTLVVLTGWTGQISIAQMSFAGIGAFVAAHIAGTNGGLFPLAILVGIAIAVPVSLLVGIPSLRLSGLFLALATMALALVMDKVVFASSSITGGLTGLNLTAAKIGPLKFTSPTSQFYLCLTVLTLAGAGAFWLRQGPIGRRLQMVRDSPDATVTLGASLTVTKLAVFAACSAVASIGGALLAVTQQTVVPDNFSFNTSLVLLLVVVIGGRSLISGAVIAGGFDLVTLLPLPTAVNKYLPLGIALSVVAIAQEPDGLGRVMLRQASYCFDTLYRIARRPASPKRRISKPAPPPAATPPPSQPVTKAEVRSA
jgi:branched-chain amino acid transport system permease protein